MILRLAVVGGDFGRLWAVSGVRTVGLSVWLWIRWHMAALAAPSDGAASARQPVVYRRRRRASNPVYRVQAVVENDRQGVEHPERSRARAESKQEKGGVLNSKACF